MVNIINLYRRQYSCSIIAIFNLLISKCQRFASYWPQNEHTSCVNIIWSLKQAKYMHTNSTIQQYMYTNPKWNGSIKGRSANARENEKEYIKLNATTNKSETWNGARNQNWNQKTINFTYLFPTAAIQNIIVENV